MKKTIASMLTITSLSFGLAGTAHSQPKPPTAQSSQAQRMTPEEGLARMKEKLAIKGAAQEDAWAAFARSSVTPPSTSDMMMVHRLQAATTTPELFDALESVQIRTAERYKEQRVVVMNLYNSLDAQQKKLFDGFIFGTFGGMLQMLPGATKN